MNAIPIILSAIIAFAATLSAGIFVKRLQHNIGVICAFSAGFFIALSLVELLPEVFLLAAGAQLSFEKPLFTAACGFFFLFALDSVLSRFHLKNYKEQTIALRPRIGLLTTLEFCSHGFIEGLAIGVGFQLQFGLGLVVAIAVVSHDFCDGVSTLALMLNSGNRLKSSLSLLFIDSIAPVLGALATIFFSVENYVLVLMLSFLAGSFLYIGGGTLLPDANKMNRPIVTVILFSLGFLLIMLFTAIGV